MQSRDILLLVGIMGLLYFASMSATTQSSTVSGVSAELPTQTEAELLESQENLTMGLNEDLRQNVMVFDTGENFYIVFTDEEPRTAAATIEGTVADVETETSVIFADDVTYSYEAENRTVSELRESPPDGELSNVTSYYNQFPIVEGVHEVTGKGAIAILGEDDVFTGSPGRLARSVVVAQTNESIQPPKILREPNSGVPLTDANTKRWLLDSEASVTVASSRTEDVTGHYISRVELSADPADVTGLDNRSQGDLVTFTANGTGSRLSVKETLIAADPCGQTSEGSALISCFPIPLDAVIHTGVLWGTDVPDANATVPYIGVSNTIQDVPARVEQGQYKITGRVINASNIDPRLPEEPAILIYKRDRIGDVGPVSEARTRADAMKSLLREQIVANSSDWESVRDAAASEEVSRNETVTAMEPTPTVTQSPVPTGTPTSQPNQEGGDDSDAGSNPGGSNSGPSDSNQIDDDSDEMNAANSDSPGLIPSLAGIAGVVLLISGLILSSTGVVQRLRGREVAYSQTHKDAVWAGGVILVMGYLYVARQTMAIGVAMLIILVVGWRTVLSSLLK